MTIGLALDVELSDETFMALATRAHEEELTVNQLATMILKDRLHAEEVAELKKEIEELKAEVKRLGLAEHLRTPAEEPTEFPFKVGDLVEVVQSPDSGSLTPNVGLRGRVTEIDTRRDVFPVRVNSIWYSINELV